MRGSLCGARYAGLAVQRPLLTRLVLPNLLHQRLGVARPHFSLGFHGQARTGARLAAGQISIGPGGRRGLPYPGPRLSRPRATGSFFHNSWRHPLEFDSEIPLPGKTRGQVDTKSNL